MRISVPLLRICFADLNADLVMRIWPNVADLVCGSGGGSRTGSDADLVFFLGQIRFFFRPDPVFSCGFADLVRI